MPARVYVISDPLAIDFIQNEDLDGFKEYLDSDKKNKRLADFFCQPPNV